VLDSRIAPASRHSPPPLQGHYYGQALVLFDCQEAQVLPGMQLQHFSFMPEAAHWLIHTSTGRNPSDEVLPFSSHDMVHGCTLRNTGKRKRTTKWPADVSNKERPKLIDR